MRQSLSRCIVSGQMPQSVARFSFRVARVLATFEQGPLSGQAFQHASHSESRTLLQKRHIRGVSRGRRAQEHVTVGPTPLAHMDVGARKKSGQGGKCQHS